MIDARIALMGQQADPLMAVQNGSNLAANFQKNKEYLKNEPLRDKLMQLRLQGQEQGVQMNQQKIQQQQILGIAQRIKPFLDSDNMDAARQVIISSNLPPEIKQEALQASPEELSGYVDQVLMGGGQSKSQFGATKTFKDGTGRVFYGTMVNDPSGGSSGSNLVAADGMGGAPEDGLTMVSDNGLTPDEQISLAGGKARATEENKSSVQLRFKPMIERAVTLARKKADEQGTVFNELTQAEAAMPQLLDVMDRLKELAPIATSTYAGRALDFAVKEAGFGATKGSTAREKYISIINNQVLPLLKPTFGAAFTVQEGESLKATMGDPNVAPETKIEVLNSFIEQKYRDIQTKQNQLDTFEEKNKLTDEELLKLAQERGIL